MAIQIQGTTVIDNSRNGILTGITGSQLTINGNNLNTSISPTGTGTVTVNPAGGLIINPIAVGNIDNTNIGTTTRGTGAFTTLTANNTATFTGAITANTAANNQSYTTTGAGTITISSGTTGSINNMSIGATTASTGAFTTLSVSSTATFTGANTFFNATGQTFGTATSTNDGIILSGRAGGTTSLRVTLSPGILTASRTVTFPDAAGNVVIDTATQTLTNKTITAVSNRETSVAVAASNIDLATANYFTRTLTTATVFTVSNVPASGTAVNFIIEITNGGAFTVTWFANARWPGGAAPTLTTSGKDILSFYTIDGGLNWNGSLVARDVR